MSLFDIFRKQQSAKADRPRLQLSAVDYMRDHGDDGVVIDVRTATEYEMAHIRDAKLIDISSPDFAKRVSELDRDEVYYLYCRSGARSQRAAEIMHNSGFKAFNIGGLQALQSAGADVV